jgi:hypothetical protein
LHSLLLLMSIFQIIRYGVSLNFERESLLERNVSLRNEVVTTSLFPLAEGVIVFASFS